MNKKKTKIQMILDENLLCEDFLKKRFTKMAQKGWLLERMEGGLCTYRAIEPQQLVFAIGYMSEGSYLSEATEQQQDYIAYCERAGWQLAAVNGPIMVFYSENLSCIPPETDPAIQVASIHKMAKKHLIWPYLAVIALWLLNIGQMLSSFFRFSRPMVERIASIPYMLPLYLYVIAYFAMSVLCYFAWYRRAKRAAAAGQYEPRRVQRWQSVWRISGLLVLIGILAVWQQDGIFLVGAVIFSLVLIPLIFLSYRIFRRWKTKTAVKWVVVLVASTYIVIISTGIIAYAVFASMRQKREQLNAPLTLADLGMAEQAAESHYYQSGNPLVREERIYQLGAQADLSYTVYQIAPLLSTEDLFADYCDWQRAEFSDELRQIPAEDFGAQDAYEIYNKEGDVAGYLLCYPNQLVHLDTDALNAAQQRTVGRRLG